MSVTIAASGHSLVTHQTASFTAPAVPAGHTQIALVYMRGISTSLARINRPEGWTHFNGPGTAPDSAITPLDQVSKMYGWFRTTGSAANETITTITTNVHSIAWVILHVAGIVPAGDALAYALEEAEISPAVSVTAPALSVPDDRMALRYWFVRAGAPADWQESSLTISDRFDSVTEALDGNVYSSGVGWSVVSPSVGAAESITITPVNATAAFGVSIAVPDGGLGAARTRSSVSEDAGSLFQATQAAAVELGVSEAFPYEEGLGSGLRFFREALTPEQVALRYYPVPTRNTEMLTTVEGETNLGRLAHTIAPRIFSRGTSIAGNTDGIVTAQQAIQHVVNRWASEHPWLVFEPIPDLRLLLPDALRDPRQYYLDNPDAGVLTTSNVVIEQEGNDRRTMREVLDEWLAIFPGTIVRQTSAGTIEIVPRVGPDAPEGPSLELAWRDLARISDGEDDPRGVYNRARVTSQGWNWVAETPLIPPTYTVFAGANSMDPQLLEDNDVLPDTEPLEPWVERRWEAFTEPGSQIEFTVEVRAYGALDSRTNPSSFLLEHFESYTFTLRPGQSRNISGNYTVLSVGGIGGVRVPYRFQLRTSDDGVQIAFRTGDGFAGNATAFGRTVWLAHVVDIVGAVGTAWTRSNREIEGEFGQDGTNLPGVDGGNAIEQSRALYGERRAEIRSNIFQLDNLQAEAVARSYVAFNINPRTIREVQQSEWNRYPVKFDHIGRFVELPNGEVAVVENRSYSDSFAPRASAMMSTFTATVSHSVIDTSTEYLFNSDGSYWENDDGTISEVL